MIENPKGQGYCALRAGKLSGARAAGGARAAPPDSVPVGLETLRRARDLGLGLGAADQSAGFHVLASGSKSV